MTQPFALAACAEMLRRDRYPAPEPAAPVKDDELDTVLKSTKG